MEDEMDEMNIRAFLEEMANSPFTDKLDPHGFKWEDEGAEYYQGMVRWAERLLNGSHDGN